MSCDRREEVIFLLQGGEDDIERGQRLCLDIASC